MEDFEKNYPDFDWKNLPAYKHPLGKDCPCPKHEYIREQISVAKNLNSSSRDRGPQSRQKVSGYIEVLSRSLRCIL